MSSYSLDRSIQMFPYHALQLAESKSPSPSTEISVNVSREVLPSFPAYRKKIANVIDFLLNENPRMLSFSVDHRENICEEMGSFLDKKTLMACAAISRRAYEMISKHSLNRAIAERKANKHHKNFTWIMMGISGLTLPLNLFTMLVAMINNPNHEAAIVFAMCGAINIPSWEKNVSMNGHFSLKTIQEFEKSRRMIRMIAIFCNVIPGTLIMSMRTFLRPLFFNAGVLEETAFHEDYSYIPASLFFAHGSVLFARTLISRKRIINLYLPSAKKKSPNRCQRITSCVSACFKSCFQRCGFFKDNAT